MRKWKGLRGKFVRELKKVRKKKTGEEGPAYVSYTSHLFLMLLNTGRKYNNLWYKN